MSLRPQHTSDSKHRTLVIGPWEGRGGIVSVMQRHRETAAWTDAQCHELSTYCEGTRKQKLAAACKAYVRAAGLIRKSTLIHVHLSGAVSCLRKLPLVTYAWVLRKPIIVHVHAASTSSLIQPGLSWAVRWVFHRATVLVALSSSWGDRLRQFARNKPIIVIPNPVQRPSMEQLPWVDSTRVAILYSGKLELRKGYHLLLHAAQSLLQEFPTLELWLAGDGDTVTATELAKELHIEQSVHVMGWVGAADMSKLFRTATVFCLPSYNEGVPMAVLEAMSHSLPVVTTRVGGLPDLIVHGQNGMFCEVGSAESLRAQLSLLLHDEQLRSSLGRQAAATVDRECGLDRVSRELNSLYRTLLDCDAEMIPTAVPKSIALEN